MVQQVTMIRVMIASPSDVAQERKIIRDVITEWNNVNASDRGLVLQAIGWETHVAPTMNGRPQAIINTQILKDCDLLVAVFWTRLGSNTGVSVSGTVEEIEEHLAEGKDAMIYFSTVPAVGTAMEHAAQFAALQEFKAKIFERGIVQEYDEVSQFRELFSRHLSQKINRLFPSQGDKIGIPAIVQRPSKIQLSSDAERLLWDAAESASGSITMLSSLDGLTIQTHETIYVDGGDAKGEARWRSALQELDSNKLVEDRTGKSEIFHVTSRGYDAAQLLGPFVLEQESPE